MSLIFSLVNVRSLKFSIYTLKGENGGSYLWVPIIVGMVKGGNEFTLYKRFI